MKYFPERENVNYRKQRIKVLLPGRAELGLIQGTVCIHRIRVLVTFSHWDFPFCMEVFPGVILSLLHCLMLPM